MIFGGWFPKGVRRHCYPSDLQSAPPKLRYGPIHVRTRLRIIAGDLALMRPFGVVYARWIFDLLIHTAKLPGVSDFNPVYPNRKKIPNYRPPPPRRFRLNESTCSLFLTNRILITSFSLLVAGYPGEIKSRTIPSWRRSHAENSKALACLCRWKFDGLMGAPESFKIRGDTRWSA